MEWREQVDVFVKLLPEGQLERLHIMHLLLCVMVVGLNYDARYDVTNSYPGINAHDSGFCRGRSMLKGICRSMGVLWSDLSLAEAILAQLLLQNAKSMEAARYVAVCGAIGHFHRKKGQSEMFMSPTIPG